jgi:signal transduction histidine kinase
VTPSMLPAGAELIDRIGWLIKLRWLAIAGVVCGAGFVRYALGVPVGPWPLGALVALLALYNLLLSAAVSRLRRQDRTGTAMAIVLAPVQLLKLWLVVQDFFRSLLAAAFGRRRGALTPRGRTTLGYLLVPRELWGMEPKAHVFNAAAFAGAQITFDLFALAALLHFSGGIENPFMFFSIFHVVIASILLSREATYLETTLGFGLISAVGLGEFSGLLRHVRLGLLPEEGAYQSAVFVAVVLFVLGCTLYLTAYMATSISSHQRSYERETVLLSAEVARKAEMLEAAYARVSQTERAKSQYMRKVAHELKAPIAAVQMMLKVLLDGLAGEIPERSRDLITRAERRARELAQLTQDLLTLSRAREGAVVIEILEVRMDELTSSVVADMREAAERAGVALDAQIPAGLGPIEGDPVGLQQLVANLIGNAIRYTPRGGRVTVRLREIESMLHLEVEDTGIGIAKDDLPRIFEEFYRAANAREHASDGTGLGLAIVKAVAKQHGGSVAVESEPSRGTRFTVDLPLKEQQPHRP